MKRSINMLIYIAIFTSLSMVRSIWSITLGGISDADPNDPEVQKAFAFLQKITADYLIESSIYGYPFLGKLVGQSIILKVTQQVVQGRIYRFQYEIKSQGECAPVLVNTELCDDETSTHPHIVVPVTQICSGSVWDMAWRNPRFQIRDAPTCHEN